MRTRVACLAIGWIVLTAANVLAEDPLPSWNEGAEKASILEFVQRVTTEGSTDFVEPAERIAVFDNDGTLWSEQPIYFQLQFAIDRVKQLADQHPEWKTEQPFQAVLEDDREALLASGEKGLLRLVMATHADMTTDEFSAAVNDWLRTARHPRFDRPYSELVYQPMLELLAYLRDRGFKTYIVSGGGIEFVRTFAEEVYGIPPEQVIGSSVATKFVVNEGQTSLVRLPKLDFINDKEGKPVAIQKFIGRRPLAAFGNSDGDLQMLQWTSAGEGPRFGLIVHHTDAEREWAYDRQSHVGRLDKALRLARDTSQDGKTPPPFWTVVDIRRDWRTIYPEAKQAAAGRRIENSESP